MVYSDTLTPDDLRALGIDLCDNGIDKSSLAHNRAAVSVLKQAEPTCCINVAPVQNRP